MAEGNTQRWEITVASDGRRVNDGEAHISSDRLITVVSEDALSAALAEVTRLKDWRDQAELHTATLKAVDQLASAALGAAMAGRWGRVSEYLREIMDRTLAALDPVLDAVLEARDDG